MPVIELPNAYTRRGVDVAVWRGTPVVVWEQVGTLQRIRLHVGQETLELTYAFPLYWPRVWVSGDVAWVAAQASEHEQWRGVVFRVDLLRVAPGVPYHLTPLGAVQSDRGILWEGHAILNTGAWGQGIAWIQEDGTPLSVDDAWRSLPASGVGVRDASQGWRVGENLTGPDRCLLIAPAGDIFAVFSGVAYEPKVDVRDGVIAVAAAGKAGEVRVGLFTPLELEGLVDVAEVVTAPQPAPQGTIVPHVEEFAGFITGEDANGVPNTATLREGYLVHRKGPVIGGTSIHKWDGTELQLRLEYDTRPHRITTTRGGQALAFLWKGMAVGEVRRYPAAWLYRWTLEHLLPADDHAHPVAMQVVAYYPHPFDVRTKDGTLYTVERGLVTALRECRGVLTWKDGIPDRSGLSIVSGNSELNYWFTGVRKKGDPPLIFLRAGLGGWTGLGPTETDHWDPWLHPTTQVREPYEGVLDPPLFTRPHGGDDGGIPMTEAELRARASYPIPRDIIQGVFDRLGGEALLKEEDRGVPGMGLIIYMVNIFIPAMVQQQITGGVPGSREGWEMYAESAYRKLWDTYLREQRGDVAPPPGQDTLRPLAGRVRVDGV